MGRSRSMTAFDRKVFRIVRTLPPGRVTTYGRIAMLIPPPHGVDPLSYERVRARWVGYAMARCPEDVPWHRVVNARGNVSPRPGFSTAFQRHLLELEGVKFNEAGQIELCDFGWDPSPAAAPGVKAPAAHSPR